MQPTNPMPPKPGQSNPGQPNRGQLNRGQPNLPRLDNWTPLASAEAVFSPEECARVLALRQDVKDAGIAADDGRSVYRKGRVCWLRPGPETNWIFAHVQPVVQQVNGNCYRMELAGFTEPLQLAEYDSGHFYDWHLDLGAGGFSIRKLSFIVQLTDPADYDGGAVEVLNARTPQAIPRGLGSVTLFPSYILHRVQEVTRGTRCSLVGWVGGPHFR